MKLSEALKSIPNACPRCGVRIKKQYWHSELVPDGKGNYHKLNICTQCYAEINDDLPDETSSTRISQAEIDALLGETTISRKKRAPGFTVGCYPTVYRTDWRNLSLGTYFNWVEHYDINNPSSGFVIHVPIGNGKFKEVRG